MEQLFDGLGLRVFERGWLSSNNILFEGDHESPAVLVDTGYAIHAEQTVALVERALGDAPLQCIVNTHLHSDHCGGNAALHARWGCEISVPAPSFDAASRWIRTALTFDSTGQRCDRFPVHRAIHEGERLRLGAAWWDVHAAGGHDPDAMFLFQPDSGVLISGDALWESRVGVIFPELSGEEGFEPALESLRAIELLQPSIVIPGHGAPFTDVAAALSQSRQRVEAFIRNPDKHVRYARRALVMFHLLEHRSVERTTLVQWAHSAGILNDAGGSNDWPEGVIDSLVEVGALVCSAGLISVPGAIR